MLFPLLPLPQKGRLDFSGRQSLRDNGYNFVLSCHFTPHMRISFEQNTKLEPERHAPFENLLKFLEY